MRKGKDVIEEQVDQLDKVKVVISERPNGTRRVQQDFSNCINRTEQHAAAMTDLNYLVSKFRPDELTAYLAARAQYRREILGHDFSKEPSLQDAMNAVYRSKQNFEKLPEEVKRNFRSHLDFMKFIDSEQNAETLVRVGLLKPKQLEELRIPGQPTSSAKAGSEDVGGAPTASKT